MVYLNSASTSAPYNTTSTWKCIDILSDDSARPGFPHQLRRHANHSHYINFQSMFLSSKTNTKCAAFSDIVLLRALVISKVDYCSSVLAGMSETQISRLQNQCCSSACVSGMEIRSCDTVSP